MRARNRVSADIVLMIGGLIVGVTCAVLAAAGNPGNSGLCMTGFMRDTAGALLGSPAIVATASYIRPELVAMLLGATVAALWKREFKPQGGASPALRFLIGGALGLAAMVFIGCTVRVWLRVGGGDLSALPGAAGLIGGIALGVAFLRAGFHLGDADSRPVAAAAIAPAVSGVVLGVAALLALGLAVPVVRQTAEGMLPGGLRAPFLASLAGGLIIGVAAQRTRFCGVSGIRDSMLIRRPGPLLGVAGLLVGVVVTNLALGQFNLGFYGQPLAHPDWLPGLVSMGAVGLAATLLGGCPFRQVVMTASGDTDAASAVLGMVVGVVLAHALGTVSSLDGAAPGAWYLLGGVWIVLLTVVFMRGARVAVPLTARRSS